jgi:hypothetical protein
MRVTGKKASRIETGEGIVVLRTGAAVWDPILIFDDKLPKGMALSAM